MRNLKKALLVAGAALALAGSPALAQDDAPVDQQAEMMAAMQQMFPKEPLTAEEESRLPQAQGIIEKMIPPGTLGEMMGGMFDKMMGPIMQMAASNPRGEVAGQLGVEASELDLTDEQAVELADILDPAWRERNEAIGAVMPNLMKRMMATMEPTMRKAMAEAYAIYFNERELADIDAFFSTESGLNFARKSFTMSSDPRILGASMEALPAMMAGFADMEAQMQAATADLPEKRGWGELSSANRARIAALTGMDQATIEENMAIAAGMRSMQENGGEMAE